MMREPSQTRAVGATPCTTTLPCHHLNKNVYMPVFEKSSKKKQDFYYIYFIVEKKRCIF